MSGSSVAEAAKCSGVLRRRSRAFTSAPAHRQSVTRSMVAVAKLPSVKVPVFHSSQSVTGTATMIVCVSWSPSTSTTW